LIAGSKQRFESARKIPPGAPFERADVPCTVQDFRDQRLLLFSEKELKLDQALRVS